MKSVRDLLLPSRGAFQAFLFTLSFVCVAVGAEPKPEVRKIEIWDQGIYRCEVIKKVKDPRVPAGQRALLGPAQLVTKTDRVPAVLGTRFGFRFKVDGVPQGQTVNLVFVGIYPGAGLDDPRKKEPLKTYTYTHPCRIGEDDYVDYSFDHIWELAPGEWTFQIWFEGEKHAEVKFDVVKGE